MGFLILTVVVVALLVKLSHWQWTRGVQKAQHLAQFEANQAPNSLSGMVRKGQRLALDGQFRPEFAVWLDNQTHQGQVGYRLFLPFVPSQQPSPSQQSSQWWLVELGWVAAPALRRLPAVPVLASRYQLSGFVDTPSERVVLKEETASHAWPARVQRIDLKVLNAQLTTLNTQWLIRTETLMDVTTPSRDALAQAGITPVWQPVVMPPVKHYGYALQWALMALAVSIGAGIWWYKTKQREAV
ncbi:SURF1 family protein [Salinivibrio proteolyticus]|uniref:SURF1-like protein n=1 Tax=Salinivibrio proteolyticus TaxID=334715 RepID=A0ABY7LC83_9GAMM|nr:SURF1 family protein [Salinivibrio proteolyticus]WBA14853.1 SURF1 family protein [Salinivibrio proteolyticus]